MTSTLTLREAFHIGPRLWAQVSKQLGLEEVFSQEIEHESQNKEITPRELHKMSQYVGDKGE